MSILSKANEVFNPKTPAQKLINELIENANDSKFMLKVTEKDFLLALLGWESGKKITDNLTFNLTKMASKEEAYILINHLEKVVTYETDPDKPDQIVAVAKFPYDHPDEEKRETFEFKEGDDIAKDMDYKAFKKLIAVLFDSKEILTIKRIWNLWQVANFYRKRRIKKIVITVSAAAAITVVGGIVYFFFLKPSNEDDECSDLDDDLDTEIIIVDGIDVPIPDVDDIVDIDIDIDDIVE